MWFLYEIHVFQYKTIFYTLSCSMDMLHFVLTPHSLENPESGHTLGMYSSAIASFSTLLAFRCYYH